MKQERKLLYSNGTILKNKKKIFKTLSTVIRVMTVPSLMAVVLCIMIAIEFKSESMLQIIVLAIFIGLVPILGYPLCYFIPKFRKKGRVAQRKAAFIFSVLGYIGGIIYALIAPVSKVLFCTYLSYFMSVIVLILFNKVIKVKASGHACGIFGPLCLTLLLFGWRYLPFCLLIMVGVIFSSLYLKRHTKTELLFGALSSGISVVGSWLAVFYLF